MIYKSPSVRSLCKAHVAKTLGALSSTLDALRKCTFYQPSLGYLWVFEEEFQKEGGSGPVELRQLAHRRKRRKVLDHRRPGERSPAEEEGIRATEGESPPPPPPPPTSKSVVDYFLMQPSLRKLMILSYAWVLYLFLDPAMDQILVRLSRNSFVTGKSSIINAESTLEVPGSKAKNPPDVTASSSKATAEK